jgi:hypothetical protein
MKTSESAERIGEMKNAYANLVENLKGKIPLERPKVKWEDNIKRDLKN